MNSPAQDIATLLANAGLGTKGIDIFNGSLADTQKTLAIGITDTGGFDNVYSVDIEKPTVQIRVRGPKFDDVYAKVTAINSEISEAVDAIIGTTRYIHILQNGQPMNLGLDKNKRFNYVLNFRMERTTTV